MYYSYTYKYRKQLKGYPCKEKLCDKVVYTTLHTEMLITLHYIYACTKSNSTLITDAMLEHYKKHIHVYIATGDQYYIGT